MANEKPNTLAYNPSPKVVEVRTKLYQAIEEMIEVRNKSRKQFNGHRGDRTPVEYWDDSDRRLNGYTSTREEQGKEDWQANYFDPVTRNKMKAFIAGVALDVPEISYRAVNSTGIFSAKRAELIKQLVRHSYLLSANPQVEIFYDAWEGAGRGTVIKYDGYLKTKHKRKFITSYDQETGEIEFEEKDVVVEDRPIELGVPLSEFFIRDFFIENVQDQPDIAWIQRYSYAQVEFEFGKYKNFKYVKDKSIIRRFEGDTKTYFYDHWNERVEDKDDYEVIRYWNKPEDRYEIWINGVDIFLAPILTGKKKKLYPFSKTILEPFEGRKFFYGKSFPHILEGIQDRTNATKNSVIDKLYRSLTPPMLVGLVNKDLLDIEDEFVNQDNKIYVPDVNQVKPLPFEGVSQGDIAMMQVDARDADLASSDSVQQGIQGEGVTAREAMLADEHARKLKGIFFMFLQDLWLQKTRLRIPNILSNYFKPKYEAIVGPKGHELLQEVLTILNVPNTSLSDGTKGTLAIQIADNENKLLKVPEIEAREEIMQNEGVPYKLIAVTSDYFDDWDFDFEVLPESLYTNDKIKKETMIKEKIQWFATLFPEFFLANKDKFIEQSLDIYSESVESYNPPVNIPPPMPEGGTPLSEGADILAAPTQ